MIYFFLLFFVGVLLVFMGIFGCYMGVSVGFVFVLKVSGVGSILLFFVIRTGIFSRSCVIVG